jgi:hypothetical protein
LDVLAALLVVAFAFCVWPPLALLAGAVALLAASWALAGGRVRIRARKRRGEGS